jgi:hypothetical protein
MSTDRHVTNEQPQAVRPQAAADWHRVAGHPAGILVLTDTPVRRATARPSAPVSRTSPRSKHA